GPCARPLPGRRRQRDRRDRLSGGGAEARPGAAHEPRPPGPCAWLALARPLAGRGAHAGPPDRRRLRRPHRPFAGLVASVSVVALARVGRLGSVSTALPDILMRVMAGLVPA